MRFLRLISCFLLFILSGCSSPQDELANALRKDDGEAISAAIARGARLNAPLDAKIISVSHGYGSLPLHVACDAGKNESVQVLLQAGADPNAYDMHGWTPLHCSFNSHYQNLGIVNNLLAHKADPNRGIAAAPRGSPSWSRDRDKIGITPLTMAAREKFVKAVEVLLKAGAKPDARDAQGRTTFWHMGGKMTPAQESRLPAEIKTIRQMLLKAGANSNPRNNKGQTFQQYKAAHRAEVTH